MSGLLERIARRRRALSGDRHAAPTWESTDLRQANLNPSERYEPVLYDTVGHTAAEPVPGPDSNGDGHAAAVDYEPELVHVAVPEASVPEPEAEPPAATAPEPEPAAEPPPLPPPAPAPPPPAPEARVPPAPEARVPPPLPPPAAHAPPPPEDEPPPAEPPPGLRQRSELRRRTRYLRQLRELQLRDLGGFLLELHRFGRERPDLLRAKLELASRTDDELRALDRMLQRRAEAHELREAGIGGACPSCGTVHGSLDNFCASCGEQLNNSR
jgi:hypothetical protein